MGPGLRVIAGTLFGAACSVGCSGGSEEQAFEDWVEQISVEMAEDAAVAEGFPPEFGSSLHTIAAEFCEQAEGDPDRGAALLSVGALVIANEIRESSSGRTQDGSVEVGIATVRFLEGLLVANCAIGPEIVEALETPG